MIRWLLNKTMGYVLYRPKLASTCVKILTHFPLINGKLISFANDEGLITHDHAPVLKQAKKANKKVNANKLLQDFEDDHLIPDKCDERYMLLVTKPKGKNHEEKSPLENWFY